MAAFTQKQKSNLPGSEYVFPKEKKYPINDLAHAKAALARVQQFGTRVEKVAVFAAVRKRYGSKMQMKASPKG